MADKKIKLDIDIATRQAQQDLKAAAKETKKLGDAVDDTRTAGKKLADAMNKVADEIDTEFQHAKKAADKLEHALGTDLVQAFKDNGKSVDDLVAELKHAGLTYNDVEQDADALAGALKHMNDVGDNIKQHVSKNMEGVREESDKAKDSMHSFVGNAVSELPGVTDTFGPLGEAVGQLTEGLLAGEVGFGSLIAAAAPIAAIALGFKLVTDVLASNKQRIEEQRKRIANYTEALRDAREAGTSAAEAIAKSWKDNGGKIQVEISNDTATLLEFGKATDDMARIHELAYPTAKRHVEDFSDELIGMGLNATQFATLANQPIEKIKEWGEEMVAAGRDAGEVNLIMQGAVGLHGDLAKAAESDAIFVKLFGDNANSAKTGVQNLRTATEKLDDAYQRLMGHLDTQDAWDRYNEALWNAADGQGNLEQDTRDLIRATADLVQGMDDIPEETKAQVMVMLDQGHLDRVQAWLDNKAKGISVPLYTYVTGQGGNIKEGGLKYATGTSAAKGGTALVGETGPELVQLPKGSKVTGSVQTRNALSRRAAPSAYNDNRTYNIVIPNQSPEQTAQSVARYNRRNGS